MAQKKTIDIGPARAVYRGAWVVNEKYEYLNRVTHNGVLWDMIGSDYVIGDEPRQATPESLFSPSGRWAVVGGKGDKGDTSTIQIGTVTTAAAGSAARVTNTGTNTDAILNFTLPRGDAFEVAGGNDINVTNTANGVKVDLVPFTVTVSGDASGVAVGPDATHGLDIALSNVKATMDADGNRITSTYATKAEDAGKLPLSGGTLTGILENSSPNLPYRHNNGIDNFSFGVSNTGNIGIYGQYGYIFVTNQADGELNITSRTSSSGAQLKLKATGELTWNNKTVECVVEKGDGYVKLTDGTQICWGDFNISSSTEYSKTFNFPRAFSSLPIVTLGAVGSGADCIANVNGRTATTCNIVIKNVAGTYAWNKHAFYIAIGTGV